MSLQQGPIGPYDIECEVAGAITTTIQVSASGDTVLWAPVPSAAVCYIVNLQFAIPGGTGLTIILKGSDGTILDGPEFVGTYSKQWQGQLSTNRCAAGSSLVLNLSGAPSAAFGVVLVYWQM